MRMPPKYEILRSYLKDSKDAKILNSGWNNILIKLIFKEKRKSKGESKVIKKAIHAYTEMEIFR